MKLFGNGGTDLAQCLLVRSERNASNRSAHTRIGSSIWTMHCLADKRSAVERVFVKINGVTHYLWRAVDHEGEVLESYVTKRRDRKAALKFLRKTMKRYGQPEVIVTDKLRSYGAAMSAIGNSSRQETGRWLNNRAENSHLPFRRRERAMLRFRLMRSLQ
ncbi:MAG: IS6 family transposase, partial [Hyphomicrobiales bacterium]